MRAHRGAVLAVLYATTIASSCAPDQPSFDVGFNKWVGFGPFFVAKHERLFDGVDVNLHFIDLEGDKRAGLYSGRLEMICETIDMFQTERDSPDYPGKIVFATDESRGGDGIITISSVRTLRDLKGKRTVSEPGQPAHFILQYLLHKEGMKLEDLNLQTMTAPDAASAFIAGHADVAGTYEPFLSQALSKRRGSHILVSSKDLPGLIVDVCVVRDDVLKDRADAVRAVANGFFAGVEHYRTDHESALAIMATHFGISPGEFAETITGLHYLGRGENDKFFGSAKAPGPALATFEMIGEVLRHNGLTRAVAPARTKLAWGVASNSR